jgi:hypothetical protein
VRSFSSTSPEPEYIEGLAPSRETQNVRGKLCPFNYVSQYSA